MPCRGLPWWAAIRVGGEPIPVKLRVFNGVQKVDEYQWLTMVSAALEIEAGKHGGSLATCDRTGRRCSAVDTSALPRHLRTLWPQ